MNSKLKDRWNLLSKTRPARLGNAVKVLRSYYYSRITQKPVISGLPISIAIEPTTACNLRCPECPSGLRSFTRPTGVLETDLFEKIVDELSSSLIYLTFYFQGEPFLHPKLLELIQTASEKNIYTSTSTNAHYLDSETARKTVESGLDRIIISIDGTTQPVYEKYRIGGKLDKVLEGTRNIVHWKKKLKSSTPHTIFQFLVVKPNEHQVGDINKLGIQYGIDEIKLKTAQIYDYEHGSPLIPDNERFSRYQRNSNGSFSIKNKLLNHCWKMWHSCVITWDGKVVPCCFDKDADHEMGNLNNQPFREIWNNDRYQSFRASILKSRSEIEICKNCTEGTKVFA